MIKLDKKDVKQISNGRFFRKTIKYLVVLFGGSLGLFFLILYLMGKSDASVWFVLAPLIVFLGGLTFWERKRKKAEEALIKEWEEKE